MSPRRASAHNLLWDPSAECCRLVCAHCRVPFGFTVHGFNDRQGSKISIGPDDQGLHVVICVDCQRDLDDPWDFPADPPLPF